MGFNIEIKFLGAEYFSQLFTTITKHPRLDIFEEKRLIYLTVFGIKDIALAFARSGEELVAVSH